MFRIWLGSLAHYNDGVLCGEWIGLPVEEDEMRTYYNFYTNNGMHDFFIADYESDLGISVGEYDDPFRLNELAERLDKLKSWELDVFCAAYALREPQTTSETEDMLDNLDDFILYPDIKDDDDLGCYYMDEFVTDKDNWLMGYIDTERLGRDIRMEAGGIHTEWGFIQ